MVLYQALAIRQFLLANLVRQPGTKYLQFRIPISILAASLHNMGEFPFTDPAEGRFQGPTLFIRGTQSHYISDKMLPLIGQFFPRFELRSITSGHWVISENPKEFRNGELDSAVLDCSVTPDIKQLLSTSCPKMKRFGLLDRCINQTSRHMH